MRLRCGDEMLTLGPLLRLKKNTFQGLVLPLPEARHALALLDRVKLVPRLRKFQHFPHALRVRRSLRSDDSSSAPELDALEERQRSKCYRVSPDTDVLESWDDDSECGVGDRLLHLLQRWQVENVAVLVARQDDSLCGRLIGPELFKLMVEAAKLALEEYYVEHIKPTDAAKIELMEVAPADTPGGPYQPLSARQRDDADSTSPHTSNQSQTATAAAVCLMTSDTIPSWPAKHQPTSDGGGRKGVRQGRINHFLHQRVSRTKPFEDAASVLANNPLSVGHAPLPDARDDVTHASGGIDWLHISRDELLKLKSIRVPVKELHYLFMCVVVLLEKPPKQARKAAPTPKQQEEFTPANFSWLKCRDVLHQSHVWSERLKTLRGSELTKAQVTALRAIFQEPSVNATALLRVSVASVKIFAWLQRLLDEYDELELGLHEQGPAVSLAHDTPLPTSSLQASAALQPRPPATSDTHNEEQQLATEFHAHSRKSHGVKIVDRGRMFANASR